MSNVLQVIPIGNPIRTGNNPVNQNNQEISSRNPNRSEPQPVQISDPKPDREKYYIDAKGEIYPIPDNPDLNKLMSQIYGKHWKQKIGGAIGYEFLNAAISLYKPELSSVRQQIFVVGTRVFLKATNKTFWETNTSDEATYDNFGSRLGKNFVKTAATPSNLAPTIKVAGDGAGAKIFNSLYSYKYGLTQFDNKFSKVPVPFFPGSKAELSAASYGKQFEKAVISEVKNALGHKPHAEAEQIHLKYESTIAASDRDDVRRFIATGQYTEEQAIQLVTNARRNDTRPQFFKTINDNYDASVQQIRERGWFVNEMDGTAVPSFSSLNSGWSKIVNPPPEERMKMVNRVQEIQNKRMKGTATVGDNVELFTRAFTGMDGYSAENISGGSTADPLTAILTIGSGIEEALISGWNVVRLSANAVYDWWVSDDIADEAANKQAATKVANNVARGATSKPTQTTTFYDPGGIFARQAALFTGPYAVNDTRHNWQGSGTIGQTRKVEKANKTTKAGSTNTTTEKIKSSNNGRTTPKVFGTVPNANAAVNAFGPVPTNSLGTTVANGLTQGLLSRVRN